MRGLVVEGRRLLVLRAQGVLRAYDDRCPHQGALLHAGRLANGVLTCSRHGWQFDSASGRGLNPTAVCLRPFAAREEEGHCEVALDD